MQNEVKNAYQEQEWYDQINATEALATLWSWVYALKEVGDNRAFIAETLLKYGKTGMPTLPTSTKSKHRYPPAYYAKSIGESFGLDPAIVDKGGVDLDWWKTAAGLNNFNSTINNSLAFILRLCTTWVDAPRNTQLRWLWTTTNGETEKPDVQESIDFLKDYAFKNHVSYQSLVDALTEGEFTNDDPDEFTDFQVNFHKLFSHLEVVKGKPLQHYDSPFGCC